MAMLTSILLAGGLALGAAGTAIQMNGQRQAAHANQDAMQEQQNLERQKQQQMELDAQRRKRDMVRQQLAARSAALAATTAQTGSSATTSSALPGAYGSIAGQTNENMLGLNQNLQIGRNMFAINSNMLDDYRSAASYSSMANFGGGLASLGGSILHNMDNINRFGKNMGWA